MSVFIGMGSNTGDRKSHLESALKHIQKKARCLKISSLYENPALIPKGSPDDWNQPFLNLAVQIEWKDSPDSLLKFLKRIESKLGRASRAKWAPRPIDLDILLFHDLKKETKELKIPHPEIPNRQFVLSPLKELNSQLQPPGMKPALTLSRSLKATPLPLFTDILNLTPDSFSDGNVFNTEAKWTELFNEWESNSVGMIDVGAESTRPGATPLSEDEEWKRLEPFIKSFQDYFKNKTFKPKLSIDTYKWKVAKKAIRSGAEVINDVSGGSNLNMLSLIKDTSVKYIFMHSLSVPANPKITLPQKTLSGNHLKKLAKYQTQSI